MRAFTNTIETKEQALANVRAHREADKLVKGHYWEDGKGCAVGCQYHTYKPDVEEDASGIHALAETVHGIPRELSYLEDVIFEGLPNEKAMLWPERFISAIPAGADLSMVTCKFMLWLLIDKDHGVLRFVDADSQQEKAINGVAELYMKRLAGNEPAQQEWDAAWAAAWDAAWAAAGAAAWAAARAAAGAAAWAAAWDAAGEAARAAAWAAARDAARDAAAVPARAAPAVDAAYEAMSDEMIELLEASKIDA